MRLPIKPLCEQKRAKKDGLANIYLQYCYDADHKTFLNTEIAIPPIWWDKKGQCIKPGLPSEFGNPEKLNDEIDRQLKLASDLVKFVKRQGIPQPGAYVKEKFSPALNLDRLAQDDFQLKSVYVPEIRKRKEGFFKHLEEYVMIKKKKGADGSATVYDSLVLHLEAFEKHRKEKITFEALDFNFYESFVDFLTYGYLIPRRKKPECGLKLNSIGKTIKNLRMFIKDRVKRKFIPPIDLSDYKIPEEETDAIYLSYEEIAQIYYTDLTQSPPLIGDRNKFVLACLTGLRFSDFSSLEPSDLRNDMLYKKQQKSNHTVVILNSGDGNPSFRA